MQLSSVDLPTPDSPTMATNSPGATSQRDVAEHRRLAVVFAQVVRPTRLMAGLRSKRVPAAAPAAAHPAHRRRPRWRCGMERSQVIWRLASWRVAKMPRSRSSLMGNSAIQGLPGLAVADAAHGGQVGVQVAARAQGLAPRRESRRPAWRRSAGRCARAARRGLAVPAKSAAGRLMHGGAVAASVCRGVERRQRLARDAEHLQRALDALRVAGRQPRGGDRVDPRQFGVQRGPAFGLRLGFDVRRAPRRRPCGMSSRPSNSALKYSMVPPTSSGSLPRAWISSISCVGIAHELGGAVGLQRVADVDQVVRHGGQFGRAWAWRCRCPCRGRPGPNRR